jgi:hypothetical protein
MRKVGRPPEGKNGKRVRDYPQLSVRVEPSLLGHVRTLARQQRRTMAEIVTSALWSYRAR